MINTANMNLPLLQAAQSQKHVTVNEALSIIDVLSQLSVVAVMGSSPDGAQDGMAYIVSDGATDDWQGRDQHIAVFLNGGWHYVMPKIGWTAWNIEDQEQIIYNGSLWVDFNHTQTQNGAATTFKLREFEHELSAGASSVLAGAIQSHEQLIGITARVIAPITGTDLTSWKMGTSASNGEFGSNLGLTLNSYANGLSQTPNTYWSNTDLIFTAVGGDFAGGTLRICVHSISINPPAAV